MITMAIDVAAPIGGRPARLAQRSSALAVRAVAVVVPVLAVATVVLHLGNGDTPLTDWWYGNLVFGVLLLVPAVLIASKRPENPVGWLMCAACVAEIVTAAGREYLVYGLGGGVAPGWLWIGWLTDSAYLVAIATLPLMLMLFPDGHRPPRWGRFAVYLPAAALVFALPGTLFSVNTVQVNDKTLDNPAGDLLPEPLAEAISSIGFGLLMLSLLAAVATLLIRYRHARGERRQQLKWVVWAGSIAVLELITEFIPDNPVAVPTSLVADALLVAALTIAILRHRLLDIDVVINRTMVFGSLSVLVAGGYVAVVATLEVALGQAVHLGPGLVATALVAMAFAPARNRLQRGVDRLMYGERRNPYGVMSELGQRLERRDGNGELAVVVETVQRALKLPYAAIYGPEGALLAEAGEQTGPAAEQALAYQGVAVGRILFQPRSGAPSFDSNEQRLLTDLSRQAGAVVHAVKLSGDLQASRERLVGAKEEERRRLRRDLHDGLGPKLAAIGLKLDAARTMVDARPERAKAVLGDVKADLRSTIDDVRQLVYGLRPPALDQLGLVGALRERAEALNSGTDASPSISVHAPEHFPPLPAAAEVAAYWIVNEAVTNVVRHAEASRCEIEVRLADGLALTIRDNGTGVPAGARAGVGTSSMAERAAEVGGSVHIAGCPDGAGTEVRVRIPVVLAASTP